MKTKRAILTLSVAGLFTTGNQVFARQIPNHDFEGEWRASVPWTSGDNRQSLDDAFTPAGWCVSHVMGMYMSFMNQWMGSTIVGEKVTETSGNSAIRLYNSPNSVMSSQIVPGYITLGTTWSTATGMGQNTDGGTFGGIDFAYKPDALSFDYRHTLSEGTTDDAGSTVAGYLWKGTFAQTDVPGEIVMQGNAKTVEMQNRERNILGLETSSGGEVSKTDGAECVAKLLYTIDATADDWTHCEVNFEYLTEGMPEKLNLIFAAGDYFSAMPVQGATLDIDNVRLVYFSRLKSVEVNGADIPLAEGQYDYKVEAEMPLAAADVVCRLMGASASATVSLDAARSTMTIAVSNVDADTDGRNEHIYTFEFNGVKEDDAQSVYPGKLSVLMGENELCSGQTAVIEITVVSDGKCRFLLPDLVIDGLGTIGDIELGNVSYTEADGVTTYSGRQENMSLMDGDIIADYVELHGTIDAEGKAQMHIDVMWNGVPITVTFVSDGKSGISAPAVSGVPAPVEYYDLGGRRVQPSAAHGKIYIRKQGVTSEKVIM